MNCRANWTTFLIITCCTCGFSQKIKYKELFVLLNAKQYTEAEPYLKKYIRANDDNPNAYLFMGIIYRENAIKIDPLKQTTARVTMMDSAAYFFRLASKTITEKEISRNDEYYQMFNQRDIRTGKFMVKMSNVTLYIEEALKSLEKSKLIVVMKEQLLASEKQYVRTQRLFLDIQKTYAGPKEFFLRADELLRIKLNGIAQSYDSCHISFNNYKATLQEFGPTGYNQDLDPQEIVDFKRDGITPADFFQDDLKIWDYKRWALSSEEKILNEITPLQMQLASLDVEFNNVINRLRKDSVSVRDDLATLRRKMIFPALEKIDARPFPLRLFELKLSELAYGSQVVEDRPFRDSLSIMLHINALQREWTLAKKADSLAGSFVEEQLGEDIENYKQFIATAYGTPNVLRSYLKVTKDFTARTIVQKEEELNKRRESLRWLVNGLDSIPLFGEVKLRSRYKPLIIKENLTAGLLYVDSLAAGYFYTITPSHQPAVKITYPVDTKSFVKHALPFVKSMDAQDEKGLVFFVLTYSEAKINDKYPATLAKIYKEEGLAWSINHTFDQVPFEISFSSETFVLTIKTKSSIGEVFGVSFDKDGKAIR